MAQLFGIIHDYRDSFISRTNAQISMKLQIQFLFDLSLCFLHFGINYIYLFPEKNYFYLVFGVNRSGVDASIKIFYNFRNDCSRKIKPHILIKHQI